MDIRNWFQPQSQKKTQQGTPKPTQDRAEPKTRRLVKKSDIKAKNTESNDSPKDTGVKSSPKLPLRVPPSPIKRQKSNLEEGNDVLVKKKRTLDDEEHQDDSARLSGDDFDVSPRATKKKKPELVKEEKQKKDKEEVIPSDFFKSEKVHRIERQQAQVKDVKAGVDIWGKPKVADDDYFDDISDKEPDNVDEANLPVKTESSARTKASAAASSNPNSMSKRDELKLSSPRKRKMKEISDDDVDEVDAEEVVKKVPAKKQATSSTKAEKGSIKKPASKAETKAETKTAETKATEKIAETKAETKAEIKAEQNQGEPHEEGEVKKKNNFWQLKNRAPPQALGSKEIPQGAPNCLIGLTFVFTGEMESISRDEAQDLVKRYGGKVTTAVSGRTSYLVVGRDVGESKLKKAKEVKTTIVDEDGFFDLIRTSKEKSDDYASASATKGKGKAKESEKIEKLAAKIETTSHTLSQLWTDKYKPEKLGDVCGNKTLVQKIANWLRNWENNLAEGFKRSGADDTGIYRSVLISGPPGIGKTTSAHLCARMEGYEVLEFNASDVRSKRIVEESLTDLIDNRTMTEFFKSGKSVDTGEKSELTDKLGSGKKVVLIMDEVDGMSAGDRGGSVELAKLIKNTKIPIICICNDSRSQKVQPLARVCFEAKFRRPDASMIRSRIMTIAHREGLKLGGNVVDELVASTQSDIRQIINMLSTYRISHNTISYDEGKNLAKMNEKYIQLNIFQICERLLTAKSWRSMQLSEKLELYFHEYQLANLMIQENYPKINPALAREGLSSGQNEIDCRTMDLLSKAADAISDGDLVDRMIHGTEQQWSLMPVHSAFSCVRPAYFMHGFSSGLEGRYNFPGWLGQNSKATKYQRLLRDVQIHMRLSISGDKNEVRQTYLPTLTSSLGLPIIKEQYDDGIRIMDEYYLSREDFDTIMELELAIKGKQPLLKRLNGTTKTSFTRKYNGANHPTPFMKATTTTSKKLGATIEIPDLEDAFVDDEVLAGGDASQEEDDGKEDGLEKDNMIKEKKVKGSGKASGSSATPKSKSKETPVKAKSSAGSGSRAKASTSKGKK